jgi:hypothetical protein
VSRDSSLWIPCAMACAPVKKTHAQLEVVQPQYREICTVGLVVHVVFIRLSACQWDNPSYLICRSRFRSPSDTQTWLVGNPPQIGSHENWWHRRVTIRLFPSYSVGLYIPMTSLFVVRLSPTNHHLPYRIAPQHLRWEVPTEFGQSPPHAMTIFDTTW